MAHRTQWGIIQPSKVKITLFAGKWKELEIIKLNKRSQTQKEKCHVFSQTGFWKKKKDGNIEEEREAEWMGRVMDKRQRPMVRDVL